MAGTGRLKVGHLVPVTIGKTGSRKGLSVWDEHQENVRRKVLVNKTDCKASNYKKMSQ